MKDGALIAMAVTLMGKIFYDAIKGSEKKHTSNGYVRTSLCKVVHKSIDADILEIKDDLTEIKKDIKELLKK